MAKQKGHNFSDLCRRYSITRNTGYKWLKRYEAQGADGLTDKSRRPHQSPRQIDAQMEERIVSLRKQYPTWGSKKLQVLLDRSSRGPGGFEGPPPARSTIQSVLKRHGLTSTLKCSQGNSWQRFEHEAPNKLWQMDFKGHFYLENKAYCYPLTILDDHSRFNVALMACKNQQRGTVEDHLFSIFKQYGLPDRILTDNGSPWGSTGQVHDDGTRVYTALEKTLMLLGIQMIHGRAMHPQTQGKEERFHRTLKTELLAYEQFENHSHCQKRFNAWREQYNCIRPHEAIDMKVPSLVYYPSERKFTGKISGPEYDLQDIVRNIDSSGMMHWKGRRFAISKAFRGDPVAIRPTAEDGIFKVYFCNQLIRIINLKQ